MINKCNAVQISSANTLDLLFARQYSGEYEQ